MKFSRLVLVSAMLILKSVNAQVEEISKNHIVFDVANTLVREVPRWMVPNLDKNLIIQRDDVDHQDKGETRTYYYMKMHDAEKMLSAISKNPNVVVSFYSSEPLAEVTDILKGLNLGDGLSAFDLIGEGKGKLLTRLDTVDTWNDGRKIPEGYYDKNDRYKKDLTKISPDISNLILITPIDDHVLLGQEGHVLYLGHPLFYAKSYVDAVANLDRNKHKFDKSPWLAKNFPKDENHWYIDFYKNSWVYLLLSESLGDQAPFLDSIKKRLSEDRRHLTEVGRQQLDGTWKLKSYHWVITNGVVESCILRNNRSLEVLGEGSKDDCLDDNVSEFDWVFDVKNLKVENCVLRDSLSGAMIEHRGYTDCIDELNPPAYWMGFKRDECAYYTSSLYWIQATEIDQCHDKHVIYNPKSQKNLLQDYFAGLENYSIEDLLQLLGFNSTISLAKFNAQASSFGGVNYPRVDHIMYRGMGAAQMSLEKTFRAIMGDMYSVVESKVLTILKHYLMNDQPPIRDDYRPLNMSHISKKILSDYEDKPMGHEEALRVAIEALDVELQKRGDTSLKNELVDKKSGSFQEWGGAALYTAPYYDIAKLYGPNVVVFREEEPRGADITYFVHKKYRTNFWPRVDNGEYIVPLYIPADEIKGVHIQSSFRMYGANLFSEAFYKIEEDGQTFIVAVDASHNDCVIRKDDGFIYYCDSNYKSVAFPDFPTIRQQAKTKAVISLCPKTDVCQVPEKVFDKYKVKGGKNIDNALLNEIVNMNMGEFQLKVFYRSEVLMPGQAVSANN